MTVLPLLSRECCSIVSWYSIPLLVEKLRVQALAEKQSLSSSCCLWLPASVTFSLSALVFYTFRKKVLRPLFVFEA